LRVFHVFGADPWVEYHYRVFCILGDPSVHIWKKVPMGVTVDHASYIPLTFTENSIRVTFSSNSLPVDSAQVTISGNSVFETGYTDSNGYITLGVTPVNTDSLSITVRGDGVYPYLGKIKVAPVSVPEVYGNLNGFGIGNVFPNPFEQSTMIHYSIPEQCDISLKIFDINGRLIKVLHEGTETPGNHAVTWNGLDESGNNVGSGMYFIRLTGIGLDQTEQLYKLIVKAK
jgi:hypothetical protein